jgi:hypothetical protein
LTDWFHLEKVYYDFASDIEAVSVHYVWTPLGNRPDWEQERHTRFMPLVYSPVGVGVPPAPLRKKVLKLPRRLVEPKTGEPTCRYLLHHYFEVFQDGHRTFSPLYTEAVDTEEGTCVPYLETNESPELAEGSDDAAGSRPADTELAGERERQ